MTWVMFGEGGCLLNRIRLLRKLSAPLLCVNSSVVTRGKEGPTEPSRVTS